MNGWPPPNVEVQAALSARSTKAPAFDDVPDVVWSRLRFDLDPYLIERAADGALLMNFFHNVIAEVARNTIVPATHRTVCCRHMADYFTTQGDMLAASVVNRRKTAELPYQLFHGGLADRLRAVLRDPSFLEAKCRAGSVNDAIADFGYLPDGDALRNIGRSIRMSAQVLADDLGQFSSQVVGRLWGFPEPEIETLVRALDARIEALALRPSDRFLTAPTSSLVTIYAKHREQVFCLAVSPDGTLAASVVQWHRSSLDARNRRNRQRLPVREYGYNPDATERREHPDADGPPCLGLRHAA
jgi:hypothetical protein